MSPSFPPRPQRTGFTLIEILIVVSIISLLVIALTLSMRRQRLKGEDALIKSDLQRLRIAFEDYYNDNNCYPPLEWFDGPEDCGSSNLQPYLNLIPCHPKTNLPYQLDKDPSGCSWFTLYANLNNWSDPDVQSLCAPGGSTLGNYCISSTNVACTVSCASPTPSPSSSPTPSPSPSPSPSPPSGNEYYCRNINSCEWFDNSVWDCTPNYSDSSCTGSSNCANTGSCTLR